MEAPWVGLSRAGGGCSPREPVCVSLPWVHAKEVTQNSPHHRLSRSCISKRAKIVVERWQIPSFVPAREPEHTPRRLLSSTPWFSAILGQSGAPGSSTRGEVAVLGRLDMFRTTKEPQSCLIGAPTALGPRVSRGALRTTAGYALRLTCWSWPTTTARRPVHVWIERRTSPRPPPATSGHGRLRERRYGIPG